MCELVLKVLCSFQKRKLFVMTTNISWIYFQIAKLFYDDFCESDFIIILHDCLLMTRNISSIADTRNTMCKSVRKFIAYDCARKYYLFTMTFLIVFIIILRDCHDKKYLKHWAKSFSLTCSTLCLESICIAQTK